MPRAQRPERRAPRISVRISGAVLGRTERAVQITELSPGGCLLCSEAHLAPGALLDLRLDLDGAALHAKARVADSSVDGGSLTEGGCRYLVGVAFLDLPPADEHRLLRFLEERRRPAAGGA